MGALDGVSVVITRAAHQAEGMRETLVRHGATVHVLPMVSYERVVMPEEAECLANLDTFNWIVFASANAVDFFVEALRAKNVSPRVLKDVELASIGPATTHALKEYGLEPVLESQQHSGVGLGDAMQTRGITGSRILLPRSRLADDELPRVLITVGAEVRELVVYDTRADEHNAGQLKTLVSEEGVDVMTFASPSSVDATLRAFGDRALSVFDNLKIFSIGPKTTARCRDYKIVVAGEANSHTGAGLIDAIVEAYQ